MGKVRVKSGNGDDADYSESPSNFRFRIEISLNERSFVCLRRKAKLFGFHYESSYAKAVILADLGLWDEVVDRRKLSKKEVKKDVD